VKLLQSETLYADGYVCFGGLRSLLAFVFFFLMPSLISWFKAAALLFN
jgi:hypothetical protein